MRSVNEKHAQTFINHVKVWIKSNQSTIIFTWNTYIPTNFVVPLHFMFLTKLFKN